MHIQLFRQQQNENQHRGPCSHNRLSNFLDGIPIACFWECQLNARRPFVLIPYRCCGINELLTLQKSEENRTQGKTYTWSANGLSELFLAHRCCTCKSRVGLAVLSHVLCAQRCKFRHNATSASSTTVYSETRIYLSEDCDCTAICTDLKWLG